MLARNTYDAGEHTMTWDGRDESGRSVPSGTYVIRLQAEEKVQARKVTLLK